MTDENPGFRFISEADMPQRGDEWREWRNGLVTATQAAVIMGEPYKSRDKSTPDTWAKLRAEDVFGSAFQGNVATRFGAAYEDEALASFNGNAQMRFEPICAERRIWGNQETMIGASLDGYRYNQREGRHEWVEIKCPYSGTKGDTYKQAAADAIPRHYYWQMLHQALVLSLAPHPDGGEGAPPKGFFFVYVPEEEPLCVELEIGEHNEDMIALERDLYAYLLGHPQAGDLTQDDKFRAMEVEYVEAKREEAALKKRLTKLRADMIKRNEEVYADSREMRRIIGDQVTITLEPSRRTDWKAYQEDHPEVDVSPYIRTIKSWTVRLKSGK